jgi:hypothetical protein
MTGVRIIDQLEQRIVDYPPDQRRRTAIHLLIWSLVLMTVNVTLYLVGILDQRALILVTLILSWIAITITAIDIVATTDVRANEDTSTSEDR